MYLAMQSRDGPPEQRLLQQAVDGEELRVLHARASLVWVDGDAVEHGGRGTGHPDPHSSPLQGGDPL